MASIRRGYSDDFTLKNNSVGIGTSTGQEALDVVDGAVKGQDLKVTGISSLTAYEGFLRADHQIAENTTLSFDQGPVSSLSGEIIVGTGQTVTVNEIVKETAGVGNGSGGQWNDLNGNYAFKTNGDPTWDGSAFVYDGTGDYHSLSGGDTSTFEVGSSNFTLEQWVNITANSSIVGTFFSKGNDNSVGTNFMSLQTTGANTTPGFFFNSGVALLSGSSVGTGGWHHYVVTRSGNNFTLYVDGTSVDTATSSSSLASGITGGINIGAQSYSVSTDGRKLNGKISITRLYSNRVLTAAEVISNYNAGHTATTSAVAATVDLNANNPASYPGTVRDVDTTDVTRAGGSEIECLKVYDTFTPPSGGTNERPEAPKPGELYYNYDFKTIEFFDGNGWRQVDNTTRSGRMIFSQGNSPHNDISNDFVQSTTLGNAVYFGDLSASRAVYGGAGSDGRRGIFAGGYNYNNTIDYVTIASAGTAVNFGDLSKPSFGNAMSCSSTRAVIYLGYTNTPATGPLDIIEYVETSTTGNSLDFGDHGNTVWSGVGAATPTRGIYGSSAAATGLQYVTIASKGNAVTFGKNAIEGGWGQGTASSNSISMLLSNQLQGSTRCSVTKTNIASLGRSIVFGELTKERHGAGSGSNSTRTLFAGGNDPSPATYNIIDYFTITTSGNAIDFGDLTALKRNTAGCSDSHGGLGGF